MNAPKEIWVVVDIRGEIQDAHTDKETSEPVAILLDGEHYDLRPHTVHRYVLAEDES